MNKIIIYLVALIVLAIAGEGGYYLGVNAGKRIGVQETLKNQSQKKTEKPTSNPTIPVVDKSALQWVELINSFPADSLWKSEWSTVIGGKFISMDENSITLAINGSSDNRKMLFPSPMSGFETVKFSQFDQKEKNYLPGSISKDQFRIGDDVGVAISFETLTGKTKVFELIKQINHQVIE